MRPRERGVTLVELMVAVVVSSIAMLFIFGTFSRLSLAMRTQARISEVEQTVVSLGNIVGKDVRAAGYLSALFIGISPDLIPGGKEAPVAVQNGAGGYGSDVLTIAYADLDGSATISKGQKPAFNAAETSVDSYGSFKEGDIAIAIRVGGNAAYLGKSCVIAITHLNAGKLQHRPGQSVYNAPSNRQCEELKPVWSDGYTVFAHYTARSYRVRPDDPRGVLEVSRSGGLVADDWEPLAMGIVDLQVAVRVKAAGATQWYSSDNMTAALTAAGARVQGVSVSLVGRTGAEISGPGTNEIPAFGGDQDLEHNSVGDRRAIQLVAPATTDAESPYYGNHAYRWVTTMIQMRNAGVGS